MGEAGVSFVDEMLVGDAEICVVGEVRAGCVAVRCGDVDCNDASILFSVGRGNLLGQFPIACVGSDIDL